MDVLIFIKDGSSFGVTINDQTKYILICWSYSWTVIKKGSNSVSTKFICFLVLFLQVTCGCMSGGPKIVIVRRYKQNIVLVWTSKTKEKSEVSLLKTQ